MAQSKISSLNLFGAPLKGTFWRDPATVMMLELSTDQQQRMDEIFRQHRISLIDLNAAIEKEELILEPMVEALPGGDQAKLLAQIDRVAQARAELEMANSRMLVSILKVMTQEQVNKLPGKSRKGLMAHFGFAR